MEYRGEWIKDENTVLSLSDGEVLSHDLNIYFFIGYIYLSHTIWICGIWVIEKMIVHPEWITLQNGVERLWGTFGVCRLEEKQTISKISLSDAL